ncbi:TetR family transcriptional regulator C-terminal domain-containing protein [Staphylococcus succinus]|uniref:TetR/AcrR family transcriptional regulator n=1 Tax=Staphylococcus succinus TaxID=61015 RepID=UPI0024803062|nr:TetR family transcriptional regulator C-terminal domain-containing protein [Staphylococcus succinus]MDH9161342.1 TetR family transcriptional regulator C-terminal domain-containing protein [Staphylococcus succinus]
MPKIVDHEERKKKIAKVIWEIIENDGIEEASIRKISAKANISTGQLRHYFSTQDEILIFIVDYYLDKGKIRAIQKNRKGSTLKIIKDIFLEIIPVDKDRKIETQLWFVLVIRSLTNNVYKNKVEEMNQGTYDLTAAMIDLLIEEKGEKSAINKDIEIYKLSALIEGLAFHSLIKPEIYNEKFISQILIDYLEKI